MAYKYYVFNVYGIVQGVGFRPYIYNESVKNNIKGYILNKGSFVKIVCSDRDMMEKILKNPPKRACIDKIKTEEVFLNEKISGFYIKESDSTDSGLEEIPPDYFVCDECLKEFNDKSDRRYGYEFITCTNCGPRYSLTYSSPFDRDNTSMKFFKLCELCKKEYFNPKDRRFHAQTISCPVCGPKARLYYKNKVIGSVEECVELIKNNKIVAVKGVGGFHLVCNTNRDVVRELRRITNRKSKPYALMFKDIDSVKKYVYVSDSDKKLLESPERPIVILKKKDSCLNHVSELDTLGCMLPYTGIHYKLFQNLDEPLIFTSSNLSGDPITSTKEEQFVDYVLDSNREIVNKLDDSVLKSFGDYHLSVRRSRGFVPVLFKPFKNINKSVLSLGGDNNNTIALYVDGRILVSEHLGNLSNYNSFLRFKEKVREYMNKVKVDFILCDMNPSYISRNYALELSNSFNIPVIEVQHHLAHAYSVALENELDEFFAVIADGSGYGVDRKIWGGEIFHNSERIGHLEEHELIGGELSIKEPKYMAFSILRKVIDKNEIEKIFGDMNEMENIDVIKTSSCGRVLDAVSYILGFCDYRDYQGRPAMILESNTKEMDENYFKNSEYYLSPVIKDNVLYTSPLIRFVFDSYIKKGYDRQILAYTAQFYIAEGFYKMLNGFGKRMPFIFSGGCCYNRIISTFLKNKGVFMNKQFPCGDGGLSFGQIAYLLYNYSSLTKNI